MQVKEKDLSLRVQQESEKSNYLEKEIQQAEKWDENQQLILQNL
jgi:hypothetical protein